MWPLVLKYGFQDDVEREKVLEGASKEQLTALVSAVDKAVFDLINSYLDETNDAEEAVSVWRPGAGGNGSAIRIEEPWDGVVDKRAEHVTTPA